MHPPGGESGARCVGGDQQNEDDGAEQHPDVTEGRECVESTRHYELAHHPHNANVADLKGQHNNAEQLRRRVEDGHFSEHDPGAVVHPTGGPDGLHQTLQLATSP